MSEEVPEPISAYSITINKDDFKKLCERHGGKEAYIKHALKDIKRFFMTFGK